LVHDAADYSAGSRQCEQLVVLEEWAREAALTAVGGIAADPSDAADAMPHTADTLVDQAGSISLIVLNVFFWDRASRIPRT
jgi:hypothetical protein